MEKAKLSSVGAVGSAVLASSCCIGPFVLTTLGVGSFGVATSLERYRPIFMALTIIILGTAWFLTYRKRRSECVDGSCDRKVASGWTKVSLWSATGLALAFMFFPQWSTLLIGASQTTGMNKDVVVLDVSGMTCSGCAPAIQEALSSVLGVRTATVDFETSRATIHLEDSTTAVSDLIEAVQKAAYNARAVTEGQHAPNSPTTKERSP